MNVLELHYLQFLFSLWMFATLPQDLYFEEHIRHREVFVMGRKLLGLMYWAVMMSIHQQVAMMSSAHLWPMGELYYRIYVLTQN